MKTKRLGAAKLVADRLFAAEHAIDIAVVRLAELNAALPLARLDANLSAIVGQEAVESAAQAMLAASQMRQQVVVTHQHLNRAQTEIGLGETSFGDELKIPPRKAEATPHLREVA